MFALAADAEGRLLVGVSHATDTRIVALDPDGPADTQSLTPAATQPAATQPAATQPAGAPPAGTLLARFPETRYIWDLQPVTAPDPNAAGLLIATGIDGRIFRLDPGSDRPELLLDTAQANVLTLAASPSQAGQTGPAYPVFAGTDTDGIVYRLDADGASFPVFDAPQPEVAALAVGPDGSVYAGTADADQSRPGRLDGAVDDIAGRPDPGVPLIPTDAPPEAPEPDPLPPDAEELQTGPDPGSETQAEARAADGDTDSDGDPAASLAAPETADETADATADATGDTDGGADTDPDSGAAAPDYDQLREEIRRRLMAARRSGRLATEPARPTPTRPTNAPTGAAAPDGNAVYRIDPTGFTTTLFSESVVILDLHLDREPAGRAGGGGGGGNMTETGPGRLLVATGSEGQLYAIDLGTLDTSILHDLDAEHLTALGIGADGRVIIGASNAAALHSLERRVARDGTYTSPALDAAQPSLWGRLAVAGRVPDGAELTVATRSGNVADPEAAAWSDWSDPVPVAADPIAGSLAPRSAPVNAPPARFLQYRLDLAAADADAAGGTAPGRAATPVVESVTIAYVTPNLPPRITSLTASYPDAPEPGKPAEPKMTVEWKATDPNADRLLYRLEAQPERPAAANEQARADVDAPPADAVWLPLAEDLAETRFEWDTTTFPTGRYTLRVTASDRLDNAAGDARTTARRSDPVVVDNHAPELRDVAVQVIGRSVTVRGKAVDQTLPIAGLAYRIGDTEAYQPVLPEDLIFDSTAEAWSVTLPRLKSGGHVLTLRVIDARGNTRYVNRILTLP